MKRNQKKMSGIKLNFLKGSCWLYLSGYTIKDEEQIYNDLLEDIYTNPRWYLDNLDYLAEFRLRWGNYRSKSALLPYKFVKKTKPL